MWIELFKFVCFATFLVGPATIMTWGYDKKRVKCECCGNLYHPEKA